MSKRPDMLLHRLSESGVIHRVQAGRYVISPGGKPTSKPLVRSLEWLPGLVLASRGTPYYVSWHTALHHHGLIEQQSSRVYVATTARKRNAQLGRFQVKFVTVGERKFFGYETLELRDGSVAMASVEKALIDSLDRPHLAGHPAVVYSALKEAWGDGILDPERLVACAIRFDSPSLNRRLGYLMSRFEIPGVEPLEPRLGRGYAVPMEPGEGVDSGTVDPRWRVSVDESVVLAARSLK
ncbi:MAG: type IV toxin-antitoxin system AbiEi family antitoxin domain-containing protein [Solirubrobacterales bacterium]